MATLAESAPGAWSTGASAIAIAAAVISALALVALHVLSPEFEMSCRMVSEYASGRYGWLLTVVFITWAIASWALAVALWPLWATGLGRIGLVFLVLAGVGQMMGGLFDINHTLHGAAFAIGVPSLTIAAILMTLALRRSGADMAMWPAHLSWISFVLMAPPMALFLTSLSRAGIDVSAQSGPLTDLPEGVTAYNGWANRLLFGASYLWLIIAARVSWRGAWTGQSECSVSSTNRARPRPTGVPERVGGHGGRTAPLRVVPSPASSLAVRVGPSRSLAPRATRGGPESSGRPSRWPRSVPGLEAANARRYWGCSTMSIPACPLDYPARGVGTTDDPDEAAGASRAAGH